MSYRTADMILTNAGPAAVPVSPRVRRAHAANGLHADSDVGRGVILVDQPGRHLASGVGDTTGAGHIESLLAKRWITSLRCCGGLESPLRHSRSP